MVSVPLMLWILLAPAVLGILSLRAIGLCAADDRLGFLAWTWPAGCMVLAAVLLAYVVLGIEPHGWWTAPFLAALALAAVARRRRRGLRGLPRGDIAVATAPPQRGGRWFVGFAVLGAGLWSFYIRAGASAPCINADEANLWAMKAKALYGDWYRGEFVLAQQFSMHPDYPLLNPLLQAWVYSQAGEIVHYANRVPIQFCMLSLWFAACAALRRRIGPRLAALLLVPVLVDHEFVGYCSTAHSDGMVALGLVVALDAWLRHCRTPDARQLALASMGLAFALWSKNEAMLYTASLLGAAGLALLLRRARPRRPSPWLSLPVGVVVLQTAWNRWFGFASDYFGGWPSHGDTLPQLFVTQFSQHAPVVARAAANELLRLDAATGLLVLPFAAVAMVARTALGARLFVPTAALLMSIVGLHLVYIGTWLELEVHLATSHVRVLCQLVPVTVVWFAAVLEDLRHPTATA